MSLLEMYDAVAVNTIPDNAEVLLGYVDVFDYYGTPIIDVMRTRFPNATIVSITVQGRPGARVCDMETGDLTPAEAAQWAFNAIQSGQPKWDPPTIYCQSANGKAVFDACAALGLTLGPFGAPTTDVVWYMAWWNGKPDLNIPPPPWPVLPPPVAHQYQTVVDQYDMNVALSSWVYAAPPAPPPTPKEPEEMFIRNPGPAAVGPVAAGGICLCSPAGAVNVASSWPEIKAAYATANVPLIVHEAAELLKVFIGIKYTAGPA